MNNMLTRNLEDVLKRIEEKPDEIYVWVPINKTDQRSIRISPESAKEWCQLVAKDSGGQVPCFLENNGETFLGDITRLL